MLSYDVNFTGNEVVFLIRIVLCENRGCRMKFATAPVFKITESLAVY